MSYQPTPETERIKGALHTNWNDLMNHARKLERERDEAREALASREVVIAQQNVITDLMLEREEARSVLQEIEAARWHTACELRRIATRALADLTIPTK